MLFGSYAYGTPRDDSDVDLLVVVPYEGGGLTQAVRIFTAVAPPFGVDIVVRRPDELKQRVVDGDFFYAKLPAKARYCMTPLTQEWVDKAEGDYLTAVRESKVATDPNYDAACFHTQQCVEKHFKARLQEALVIFPFTHGISTLMGLCTPIEPGWLLLRTAWESLSVYAVSYRYPGITASCDDARDALKIGTEVRAAVRLSLGLA